MVYVDKRAVPIFGNHDGFHSSNKMHLFIKMYKCYQFLRPSRLVLFLIAIVIIWRYHIVYQRLQDECETKYNLLKNRMAQNLQNRPTIYGITPTFARPVQKAELTRLSQTFMLVPKFHWIVVEDAAEKSDRVKDLLKETNLKYTHLNVPTPSNYKLGKNDPNWKKPRGVEQRNAALNWLRTNLDSSQKGVVFFADDDNTYSVKLFEEMIKVQKVGVWPVGLVGGLMVEKPICDKETNKVVSFNAVWKPDRPFPIDMAAFAINLNLILDHPEAVFAFEVPSGYQESEILKKLVKKEELEPLGNCTQVNVWHTRTESPKLTAEQMLIKKGKPSNAGIEV